MKPGSLYDALLGQHRQQDQFATYNSVVDFPATWWLGEIVIILTPAVKHYYWNWTARTVLSSSWVSDHSALSNLDYNSSGHTGFQPALEKAHDWVSPNDYCWLAPLWSVISDAVWTITRIVVANDWTTTSSTLTNVKWNDRLTLPF